MTAATLLACERCGRRSSSVHELDPVKSGARVIRVGHAPRGLYVCASCGLSLVAQANKGRRAYDGRPRPRKLSRREVDAARAALEMFSQEKGKSAAPAASTDGVHPGAQCPAEGSETSESRQLFGWLR